MSQICFIYFYEESKSGKSTHTQNDIGIPDVELSEQRLVVDDSFEILELKKIENCFDLTFIMT